MFVRRTRRKLFYRKVTVIDLDAIIAGLEVE